MVAAHPAPGHSVAHRITRALTVIRHMTPPPATDPPLRVNWGVVLTNAVGVVIGLAMTASVSGVVYLVWRLPSQQEAILRKLEQSEILMRDLASEVDRLEKNDRRQDERLLRIEERRR
jgi:hypothetical protein